MQLYFEHFYRHLCQTPLERFSNDFKHALTNANQQLEKHGEWQQWIDCINNLPNISTKHINLAQDTPSIGLATEINSTQKTQLTTALQQLYPWRKGPFNIFGTHIDCEWRSDWKWQRLLPHIRPLKGKTVLDVGCGNGYHSLRMLAEEAKCVIGIDPVGKFFMQYLALKKYLQAHTDSFHFLPLRIEQLPTSMRSFDAVFSMGVLYHRRSPFEHLDQLKQLLKPGGELILETLIVDGDENTVLVPSDRYACMRNVWFIPSSQALIKWLQRSGWENIRLVDVNTTQTTEQRSTTWMPFKSLVDFLDPNDSQLTIEGYPAPKRAIFLAQAK